MMAGLQRSSTSFRRQGSSGLVWDDRFLSGELNRLNQKEDDNNKPQDQQHQEQSKDMMPSRAIGSINTTQRSRSNGGGRAFRTGKVTPEIEPPSPRVSACGFCSAFGNNEKTRSRPKSGRRRT